MIAGLIGPQDRRWGRFLLHGLHDAYHLPAYSMLVAKYEGGEPCAFYAEKDSAKFLIPLIVREIPASLGNPNGWCDAVTPHGYSTPLIIPPEDEPSLELFLNSFKDIMLARGIVSVFLRMHPLIALPGAVLSRCGELVAHGKTIYIDLSAPEEDFWDDMTSWHKGDIQRMARLGFTAQVDDWGRFDEFISAYHATMRRLSASDYYSFPESYFYDSRVALGEHLHLCTVLSSQGEVASAALFTAINGIVTIHLLGTSDNHIKRSPSKLAHVVIYKWAKNAGNRILHLGGGVGGRSDSLFQFKTGFSRLAADFYTCRLVIDEDKYQALVRYCRKKHKATNNREAGFFPAYRERAVKNAQAQRQGHTVDSH